MKAVFFLGCLLLAGCAEVANVTVRSTPSGATVAVVGKGQLGTTPLQLDHSASDCFKKDSCVLSFYLSKKGYEDARIEKVIEGGDVFVHAYLQEKKTELVVKGYPTFARADTYFKNKYGDWKKFSILGSGLIENSVLDAAVCQEGVPCPVRITVKSAGFKPLDKIVEIKRGERRVVEYALTEYAMIGEITSYPGGVDVYERTLGYLGRTPFQIKLPYDQLVRISPQRKVELKEPVYLFLKFEKPGLQSLEKIAEIGVLNEALEPAPFFTSVQLIPVEKK